MTRATDITGVILAGGEATRLGGRDKGWMEYEGRPLIGHALDALRPQVGRVIVNANRNLQRYTELGWPVVSDPWPDHRGPLAGLLAAMRATETDYVLCIPCDTPRLPADLATRLLLGLMRTDAECCVARTPRGMEPLVALARRDLRGPLEHWLHDGGGAAHEWWRSRQATFVDLHEYPQGLLNINTEHDLNS